MPHPRTRLRVLVVAALAVAITGSLATAAHAEPSTSDLTKKIEEASNKLEDVTESYNKMRINLQKTMADEKKLAASLQPAKLALQAASSRVGTLATTSYMQGRIGPMAALLDDGENRLIDRINLLDQISRANQRDIVEFTEITQDYAARQAALKATQAKQTAQVKALAARKKQIQVDLKKLYALRTAAYGRATESAPSGAAGSAPAISGSAGVAVDYAYVQANKPAYYGWGDDGPDTFDCSGLTMAAWRAAGKSLPHNAAEQYYATARITKSQLQPGDLVFYRSLGHVGIYVGNEMIIDAYRTGEPVRKRTMYIMTPYGYGRVK